MGKIFKNLVISHTNDFPANKNDKIKGWIENNGGVFTKDLTSDVTHLIASLKSWKRYSPIVKEARHRRIWILRLEWLEDSLLRRKPKRLEESEYSYEQMRIKKIKRTRKQSTVMAGIAVDSDSDKPKNVLITDQSAIKARRVEKAGIAFDKACQVFEKKMAEAGFHPYTDSHKSVYMISLIRRDILKSRHESHKLQLYESNEQPHTYACITQYSQLTKTETMTLELAPPGSTWDFAWDMFRKFFKKKCGRSWTEVIEEKRHETNLDGEQEDLFQYELPQSFKATERNQETQHPEYSEMTQLRPGDLRCPEQANGNQDDPEEFEEHNFDDKHLP